MSSAIKIRNLNKVFYINDKHTDSLSGWFREMFTPRHKMKKLHVIKNLNFDVIKGETLGIIGRNGSGKSTLVKLMSGAYVPDKGSVVEKNGTSMLMNLKVGMSAELTARQNIYVVGSALGLKIKEIDEKFDEILAFSELEEFIDTKVRAFSNGMLARLSFSVAVHAGADIMFLDEVFAVGDKKFKDKAIKEFEKNWLNGKTTIMVSHMLGNMIKYCDRILYLKDGEIAYLGDPKTAINIYEEDNNV